MYVDESGDTGLVGSPTRYFCLSGIAVHEYYWRRFIERLIKFKKTVRDVYGLPIRQEIHASEFVGGKPFDAPRYERFAVLRNALDELAAFDKISITNVIVDKQGKPPTYDVFHAAWGTLFQRFENTLKHGNFPGACRDDRGIVFTDATGGVKLERLMRKMSVFNYIPNDARYAGGSRNVPIKRIIEDPIGRDSRHSLPIQMADVSVYFLHQYFDPNSYIKSKHARKYFERLFPVLNTYARRSDRLGIVKL